MPVAGVMTLVKNPDDQLRTTHALMKSSGQVHFCVPLVTMAAHQVSRAILKFATQSAIHRMTIVSDSNEFDVKFHDVTQRLWQLKAESSGLVQPRMLITETNSAVGAHTPCTQKTKRKLAHNYTSSQAAYMRRAQSLM